MWNRSSKDNSFQNLLKQLPDTTHINIVIKSHIPAVNAPIRINVLQEQYQTASHACSVVDRLVPKINPRKWKGAYIDNGQNEAI